LVLIVPTAKLLIFDSLRLKENNLRIKFIDTSSSSSFPTIDWEMVINDSVNCGLNRFSIAEKDSGLIPFTRRTEPQPVYYRNRMVLRVFPSRFGISAAMKPTFSLGISPIPVHLHLDFHLTHPIAVYMLQMMVIPI